MKALYLTGFLAVQKTVSLYIRNPTAFQWPNATSPDVIPALNETTARSTTPTLDLDGPPSTAEPPIALSGPSLHASFPISSSDTAAATPTHQATANPAAVSTGPSPSTVDLKNSSPTLTDSACPPIPACAPVPTNLPNNSNNNPIAYPPPWEFNLTIVCMIAGSILQVPATLIAWRMVFGTISIHRERPRIHPLAVVRIQRVRRNRRSR